MKINLTSYQENWLLKWGAIGSLLLVLLLIIILSFSIETTYAPSASSRGPQVVVFILSGIFIIPIIEEISFRGVFLKNKWWAVLGFILMGLYATILVNLTYTIIYVFYLIYFIIGLYKYKNNVFYIRGLYVLNALLFTVAHITDAFAFFSLDIIVRFVSAFSVALICIWLVINFNLLRAIIFHVTMNGVFLTSLFITLQYPDTTIHIVENDAMRIEWQKSKLYPFEKEFINQNDTTRIYKNYILKDLPLNHKDNYEQKDEDRPYNLTIIVKDSVLLRDTNAYSEQAYELLIEESLLISKPSKHDEDVLSYGAF